MIKKLFKKLISATRPEDLGEDTRSPARKITDKVNEELKETNKKIDKELKKMRAVLRDQQMKNMSVKERADFLKLEREEEQKKKEKNKIRTNSKTTNRVKPKMGSIVHCGLALNTLEHSGIYVGHGKIAHLNGDGTIELVTPQVFMNRLNGNNKSAKHIYISCRDGKPVGKPESARTARDQINKKITYRLIYNNCHVFSSGCLTGNFNNHDCYFSDLEERGKKVLNLNEWLIWEFE